MNKLDPIFYTLGADAHISVNKALGHAIGLSEAALYAELLSRRNYFEVRGELTPDGFFFNTVEDLRSGSTLTAYQQRLALKKLIRFGLIDVRVCGLPATRYFRIVNDAQRMQDLLEIGQEKGRKSPISHSKEETSQLEVKELNTNNTNGDGEFKIDPELMRDLSILVSAHEQAKPTRKQTLQRSHSVKAQSGNGKGVR